MWVPAVARNSPDGRGEARAPLGQTVVRTTYLVADREF